MKSATLNRRVFMRSVGAGVFLAAGGHSAVRAQETGAAVPQSNDWDRRTVLEDVGTWVAAMNYESMPDAVIKKARYLILDTIGCALGAVNAKPVMLAREVVRLRGGNAQATVIGSAWKTSCDEAAFLNAMQIRYLDFNDYAAFGFPHHPSVNLATALAFAESQGMSGRDLLLGLAVGYEVHIKVRDASAGKRRGFDLPSIEAQYASAACAARLLGLDAEGIGNAMAIAGSFANTLSEVRSGGELSNAKGTAEALAVRNGTFSALLSRAGLKYPPTIMDGANGYARIVNQGLKEDILRRRSADYEIMKSCTKMWPSIGTSQAPIAAALNLRDRGISADDIELVTLSLSNFGFQQQQDFLGEINTREHADHSAPYLVSRAFIDGDLRVEDFEERRFRDPRAIEFIDKIKLEMDPLLTTTGGDVLGCRMAVRLKDGAVQKIDMPYPPGSFQNPATDQQIQSKFLRLAEPRLGRAPAQKAMKVILAIETQKDLKVLMSALALNTRGAE